MDEGARIRHLEMIQAVISRLAQDSFAFKGWTVVLVSAVFALAATKDASRWFILVALLPSTVFWGLDAYYLRQERLFRRLYDATRRCPLSEWGQDPFSMSTARHGAEAGGWLSVCFSKTIAGFYLPVLVVVVAVLTIAAVARAST